MCRCILLFVFAVVVTSGYCQSCTVDKRITPENYLLNYWSKHREIRRAVVRDSINVMQALSTCDAVHCKSEVCLHNRFLFVDFILYFDLENRYQKLSGKPLDEFSLELMKTRDSLYWQWVSSIEYKVANAYHEWEGADLRGLSASEFINLGTERFRWLSRVVKLSNRRPNKRNEARLFVYKYMQANTPFSSIMALEALSWIELDENRSSLSELKESVENCDCEANLWEMALVSNRLDSAEALKSLGILAAQRMYLLRDHKSWMEANLSELEFNDQFEALKNGSATYFLIETSSATCLNFWNYPADVDGVSSKSYHFYTCALLAYELAKKGYDEHTCIKEATRPARKYKRAIRYPGVVHNIWLRNRLFASTVGDYRQVMIEQKMGAKWGYSLFQE